MRVAAPSPWLAGLALLAIAALPQRAAAQTPVNPSVKSPATGKELEITVGGVFLTPVSMGSQNINLIAPNGSPYTLAATTSKTAASFGLEARLGFRASNSIRFEVVGGWSSVGFETEVSGDQENASSTTASLPVNRFTAGGAVTFGLTQKSTRDVYAIAGASWMRDLSELSSVGVYDDGAIVDGGAGIKMWFHQGTSGHVKRLGVRLEGRVGVATGGLSLNDKSTHFVSTFVGSFIIGS
jgi:hypothetical protein